jgi:pimeloyl-ACP methyl ester carboxylesterase
LTEIATAYLYSEDPDEREALRQDLEGYEGDLDAVVSRLRPTPAEAPETGLIRSRPFLNPRLAARNRGETFSLYVPEDYDAGRAYGLVLFLHGGGHSVPRDTGNKVFDGYGATDLFRESGFIVCTPCAPYNERSFASWNLPEVDTYLADVIEEVSQTYHIDPDRVFLGGHSMGGMGAVHLAQRLSDRFAGVLASGSCWDIAFWPSVKGTVLWLLQGINDATMFRRRHGTDIAFARLARRRLEQFGVAHVYREHAGRHTFTQGRPVVREWLQWAKGQRRDPFYPHVVAATPRGCTPWIDWRQHRVSPAAHNSYVDFHDVQPAPHLRWVTVEGMGTSTIAYDVVETSGCRDAVVEDWDDFHLTLKRKHARAAVVEAVRREDGVFEVSPVNATGFTLWLHPGMCDLGDVRILVNGKERHCGPVQPRLSTLLDSYRRRRDWGLLYPAKVTIMDEDGSWEVKDQIGVEKEGRA